MCKHFGYENMKSTPRVDVRRRARRSRGGWERTTDPERRRVLRRQRFVPLNRVATPPRADQHAARHEHTANRWVGERREDDSLVARGWVFNRAVDDRLRSAGGTEGAVEARNRQRNAVDGAQRVFPATRGEDGCVFQ